MKRLRNQRGYTLVELTLATVLVGIMASVGAFGMAPVLDSWVLGSSRSQTANSSYYSIQRMTSEIAQIRNKQSVSTASSTFLGFNDVNNNSVTFTVNGSNLLRNNDILARGIVGLTFTYRDLNDQILATPQVSPSTTDIWRITIEVVQQSGNQQIRMKSDIHPRNFLRSS